MIAIPHCRLMLLAAALLALLAAPVGVQAACGDYLQVGGDHQTFTPAKPAPKPCDGPHCSQGELPQQPLAPVPPTIVSDDLGYVVNLAPAAITPRTGWLDLVVVLLAIHTPSDIFHPPR